MSVRGLSTEGTTNPKNEEDRREKIPQPCVVLTETASHLGSKYHPRLPILSIWVNNEMSALQPPSRAASRYACSSEELLELDC